MKCRDVVRDACTRKCYSGSYVQRPFGGLNVLLSGDLWQLEPPSGTFLGALPTALLEEGHVRRGPTTAYGQLLVWGGPEHGVQGMTELLTCERTTDAWLQEVQAQVRVGNLSADMRAFLHGQPTTVPGSWLRGDVGCGNPACRTLRDTCSPRQIQENECGVCANERKTRRRVARGPEDDAYRLQFDKAAAIFATNDTQRHVNKVRAAAFARERKFALALLPARDCISAPALREKPDLKKCKKHWLKHHDRHCGSLHGLLPLCVGMPVRLTEHLDRSEKSLLKGRLGAVKGWQSENGLDVARVGSMRVFKTCPDVVWVEFHGENATWQLDGVPAAAVYPIVPRRASEYLDQKRKQPMLRISRMQVPLAPAFALTAHSAQGMTLDDGVILDCVLGTGGNIITVYIAMTRVRERAKLPITRPFPPEDFQKGLRGARDLLLDCWRGNAPDWDAIRARYNTTRTCVALISSSVAEQQRDVDARVQLLSRCATLQSLRHAPRTA
ncbi:pfh1 [Symbiodinium pilosum]|uniref:Pfh1 protein n=1 Tax=Symbiodinium pilosum TaxID=2952 RepID=A0A812SU20_SYMPI|nr:pfh1 [Symbiodinium pilosum]